MTRHEQIKRGKLWQVYRDKTPDTIMAEGSRTHCLKWIRDNSLVRFYNIGHIRLGRLIFEP